MKFGSCVPGVEPPVDAGLGGRLVPYHHNKHFLLGKQEGHCNGCRSAFEFRHLEVDHIIPRDSGGQDNIENLQLLCAHCNRVKGNRSQEYLMARLAEMGIAA